jgi:hypothetical protein
LSADSRMTAAGRSTGWRGRLASGGMAWSDDAGHGGRAWADRAARQPVIAETEVSGTCRR